MSGSSGECCYTITEHSAVTHKLVINFTDVSHSIHLYKEAESQLWNLKLLSFTRGRGSAGEKWMSHLNTAITVEGEICDKVGKTLNCSIETTIRK